MKRYVFALLVTFLLCDQAFSAPYLKDGSWKLTSPGCRKGQYPGIPEIIGVVPETASKFAGHPVLGGNCLKYTKAGPLFFLNPITGKPSFSLKLKAPREFDAGAWAFAALTDGSFLVGGDFNSVGGQTVPGIVKLTSQGSVDLGFAPPIPTTNDSSAATVDKIIPLPWGPVFLRGGISFEYLGSKSISRGTFNSSSGAVDPWLRDTETALKSELAASAVMIKDAYVLKNQNVLIQVLYVIEPSTYLFTLVRYLPTGARDTSFNFTPLPLTGILSDRTSEGLPGTFTTDVDYRLSGPFLELSSGQVVFSHVYFSAGKELDELVSVGPDGTYYGAFTGALAGEPSRIAVLSDDTVVAYIYRGYKRSYLLGFSAQGTSLGKVKLKSLSKNASITGVYPSSQGLFVETLTQLSFQVTGVEKFTRTS